MSRLCLQVAMTITLFLTTRARWSLRQAFMTAGAEDTWKCLPRCRVSRYIQAISLAEKCGERITAAMEEGAEYALRASSSRIR